MKAAGLASPDISILSDEFLVEVRETDKKNLAIEALKKLINGDVRAQSKRNVTQAKAFSERLDGTPRLRLVSVAKFRLRRRQCQERACRRRSRQPSASPGWIGAVEQRRAWLGTKAGVQVREHF
jgi:hypothetical protein